MKTFFITCLSILSLNSLVLAGHPMDRVVKKLAKGAKHLDQKKVAVLTFVYHGEKVSSGSSVVSEQILTKLVGRKGIKVIERRLLQKILEEQKLSETGVLDPQTVKKMGQVLGVDAIVTGTLNDLDEKNTEINARLILTQSGEIIAASEGVIERTWTDRPRTPRAKRIQRKVKKPQRAAPRPEPEVDESEEMVEDVAPRRRINKNLKLSNENFAPGRRIYHSSESSKNKKKKKYRRGYDDDGYDEYEEDYYDDDYDDSSYSSRKKSKKSYKSRRPRSSSASKLMKKNLRRSKPRLKQYYRY